MKKKLALLLALVLCLSSLSGIAVVAEGEAAATPSVEIALYTVPMRATVSILYAVKAEGYASLDGLKLIADKGNGEEEVAPAGVMTLGGVRYIVFDYSNLSASEMDKKVTACIDYNGTRGNTVTYSVKDFADNYLAGEHEAKYEALVEAMIAYGDAVKAMSAASAAK